MRKNFRNPWASVRFYRVILPSILAPEIAELKRGLLQWLFTRRCALWKPVCETKHSQQFFDPFKSRHAFIAPGLSFAPLRIELFDLRSHAGAFIHEPVDVSRSEQNLRAGGRVVHRGATYSRANGAEQ